MAEGALLLRITRAVPLIADSYFASAVPARPRWKNLLASQKLIGNLRTPAPVHWRVLANRTHHDRPKSAPRRCETRGGRGASRPGIRLQGLRAQVRL